MKDLSWLGDVAMVKLGIHHTEDEAAVKQALGKRKVPPGPWIIIPYWDGSVRVRTSATNGHKYDSPHKSGTHLYIGFFGDDSATALRDKTKPLVIVEGEFCALAAQLCGLRAVGIAGCDGWVAGKGSKQLIPLLEALAEGSDVIVALDGDVVTNKNVARAQNQLGRALQDAGARVYIAPVIPDGRDLEDVLSAQGKEAAAALVALSACKRADYDLVEELSDRGLANRFVRAAGDRVRWVDGGWMAVPVDGPAIWCDADAWFPEWALTLMHAFAKEHVGDPGDIGKAAERAVRTINGARSGRAILGLVREQVAERTPELFFDQRRDLITVGGECIETRLGAPEPLTPAMRITHGFPDWTDGRRSCPTFLAVLEDALPDDESRRAFRLMCGLMFGPTRDVRAFVMLLGPSGAGKSAIMRVIYQAMGHHARKASKRLIRSDRSGQGENITSELAGCCQAHVRLVWVDELSGDVRLSSDWMKEASSGPETVMNVRPFGSRARSMPFRAMLFLSSNEMPQWAGYDDALKQRMWAFEFERSEGRKVRPGLEAKLKREAEGVRQWLLDASIEACELLAAGAFPTKPQLVTDHVEELADESNHVSAFRHDELEATGQGDDRVSPLDMAAAFQQFMGGSMPFNARTLHRRLRSLLNAEGVRQPRHPVRQLGAGRAGKTERMYVGVKLHKSPKGHKAYDPFSVS